MIVRTVEIYSQNRGLYSEKAKSKSLINMPFLARFLSPNNPTHMYRGNTTHTYVKNETTDDC